MTSTRNRYLPFAEAYKAYAERVKKPVTQGAVRRWLNEGRVAALKKGTRWQIQVQDLIRYHNNVIGTGVGKKRSLRRERITPVSEYQLDEAEWAPHVEKFLKGRDVVRPRQVLDLVGFPQDKSTPELGWWIDRAKELLRALGWEQMPSPHSYDWAPAKSVKKAKLANRAKPRTSLEMKVQTKMLLRWLKSGGMYTLPQIRDYLKLTDKQASSLVYSLAQEGKIARLGTASSTMYYHP